MSAVAARSEHANAYQRRRPEDTALYEIVRDNLETLYGAIDDGALDVRIPKHARKELEALLECGILCRGFARLYCASCKHSQLVAFACKGRGFCPSCLGRRMCATAANLMERVLPEVDLRQWVLTFPFAWRRRLAQDGALLRTLTRLFVDTVQRFYAERTAAHSGGSRPLRRLQEQVFTPLRRSSQRRYGDLRGRFCKTLSVGVIPASGAGLLWHHIPETRAIGSRLSVLWWPN